MYNLRMAARRTNEEWLSDLCVGNDRQAQAIEDLRAIILRGLPYAVEGKITSDCPEYQALVDHVLRVTQVKVLDTLAIYDRRGDFTTWVHKIAVREALVYLRRNRCQNTQPATQVGSVTKAPSSKIPDDPYTSEKLLAESEFLQYLHCVLREELSEKQRQALQAMIMQRVPKEDVMQQLKMDRKAYFEMIHDARLRLQRRFLNDRGTDVSP